MASWTTHRRTRNRLRHGLNPKNLNKLCTRRNSGFNHERIVIGTSLTYPPVPQSQTRRRRYFENPQDIKKRKQSTPRKKKGAKPRTAAQALAEKEQAALNPGGRGGRGGFRGRD